MNRLLAGLLLATFTAFAHAATPAGTITLEGRRWDVLAGAWRADGAAVTGTGGWLLSNDAWQDGILELDVELLSGPSDRTFGVALRASTRDKPADLNGWTSSGYAVNLTATRTFNAFIGVDGQWSSTDAANPGFKPAPAFKDGVNHLKLSAIRQTCTIELNGQELTHFTDARLASGKVLFWVESTATQVRFSNIRVSPKSE